MVTSGTVSVRVVVSGRPYNLSKSITVNNRSGFAFTAVAAQEVDSGFDCEGTILSIPSPPTAGEKLGRYCLRQKFSIDAREVNDGPNQGFKYVFSVVPSLNNVSTGYFYLISPDLKNTNSEFYKAQCGNYNSQTNTGFTSGANLLANAIRHEAGSTQSHYNNYVMAQNDPSNNLGVVAEKETGSPLKGLQQFTNDVRDILNARVSAIKAATDVEPCGTSVINYDANCMFQGHVNYADAQGRYQSCQ